MLSVLDKAMENPFKYVQQIDFLDIGCSGTLDEKWAELFPLLSYIGFDPNTKECERLNAQSSPYKSARYFPYAIADEQGSKTLYKTKDIYCYSLLRPNHRWLKRFSYADHFVEIGTESIQCVTLDVLEKEQDLHADIIKLDTQGLELPILQTGERVLRHTFCVEAETGFVENYQGETTYAQLDEFLRSRGFLMFNMMIYRVSRTNSLAEYGKHQPLWCETTWLFDFIGQAQMVTTEQALKCLLICKILNYVDYGLELAKYFHQCKTIDATTLHYFENLNHWKSRRKLRSTSAKLLSILPRSITSRLLYGMEELFQSKC